MDREPSYYVTRIARTESDRLAAERLRYAVFVEELGGDGPLVDHAERRESDRFDPFMDHLVLVDTRRSEADLDHVVGVYRLLGREGALRAGQFYSESEFDLDLLRNSGKRLLELGRSCLHPAYRGGTALFHLWSALAEYVRLDQTEILFGAASFKGTDVQAIGHSLSLLYHRHLAPEALRVRAVAPTYQSLNLVADDQIDRAAAMRAVPPLIKAYLRLGGVVGDGAYVDYDFNTIDVCLMLDTSQLNERAARLYGGAG